MLTTLYRPPDVEQAHADWLCSCGPASLAALLGRSCESVRPLFPDFRGWVAPTAMESALTAVPGCRFIKHNYAAPAYLNSLPLYGLAFLQITGSWDAPGVPVGAAYRRTHWISVRTVDGQPLVYDINAGAEDDTRGDWWPVLPWASDVMAAVVAGHRGATGWRVRAAYEVR